jgi:DNA invertase Pin-like site-specific DNA recombinase
VTHTLDRYARNLVVALTTLANLHEHGITYSSVTESDFDYSNPDKRLHLSILAMFAEYFSEKLSQHTRKGKRERAASGLPNGDIPYGYINPDTGTDKSGNGIFNTTVPVQVPDEAAHVRRAFEAYASGTYSDLDVAKMLNAAGSRTRNKWAGGARPWSKDTVTALLTNAFYAGWIEYRGQGVKRSEPAELYPGQHEPLISQEVFDTVQQIRKSRTRRAAIPCLQK